jgi:hypothetical protein
MVREDDSEFEGEADSDAVGVTVKVFFWRTVLVGGGVTVGVMVALPLKVEDFVLVADSDEEVVRLSDGDTVR